MAFVPKSFEVPDPVVLDGFRLRHLSVDDLEEDYAAVMESVNELQGVFGEYSHWPSPDLTERQDLVDLGWHEKEFQRRSSFAYVVEDANTQKYLGCLYLYPSRKGEKDADVYMWLRTPEYSDERMKTLWGLVEEWLKSWPFENLHFPTRKI